MNPFIIILILMFIVKQLFGIDGNFYLEKYINTNDFDSALTYLVLAKENNASKDSVYYYFADYFLKTTDLENALLANLNIKVEKITDKRFKDKVIEQREHIYDILNLNKDLSPKKKFEEKKREKNLFIFGLNLGNRYSNYFYPLIKDTVKSSYNGVYYIPQLYYKFYGKYFNIFISSYYKEILKKSLFSQENLYSYSPTLGLEKRFKHFFINSKISYYNNNYADSLPNSLIFSIGSGYSGAQEYFSVSVSKSFSKNKDYSYLSILPTLNLELLNYKKNDFEFSFALDFWGNITFQDKSKYSFLYQKIKGVFSKGDRSLDGVYEYNFQNYDGNGKDTIIYLSGSAFLVNDTLSTNPLNVNRTLEYLPYFNVVKTPVDSMIIFKNENYSEYSFGFTSDIYFKRFYFNINPALNIVIYPKSRYIDYYMPSTSSYINTTIDSTGKSVILFYENVTTSDLYYLKSLKDTNNIFLPYNQLVDSLVYSKADIIKYVAFSGALGYRAEKWMLELSAEYKFPFNTQGIITSYSLNDFIIAVNFRRYFRW